MIFIIWDIMMKNVYMVQASTTYSGNNFKAAYLPYATGLLVSYAWTNETVKREYCFKRFVFTREAIESVISSLDNPSVIGFSNYVWNTEYNKALAKRIKEVYPECITIFGGHNVSPDEEFLREFDYIDFLIHGEGEEAFLELLLELLNDEPDFSNVSNVSFRNKEGGFTTNPIKILTKVDYPSPYLTGVFDDIIKENPDMQLDAILETTRGCPKSCAYCDWGCNRSKVKLFPIERVLAEIEWFAKNKIAYIFGADANFGAFERDEEITDHIVEMNQKYGYPERIQINYAKDKHDIVFRISQKFEKCGLSKLGSTLSFQSLNPDTLESIGRKNMSLDKFKELMLMYRNAGVRTYSELILGLPCETYESFCRGIGMLFEAGQHEQISIHNCVILPNSPMGAKDYIKKYGIKTANVFFYVNHGKAETEIVEKTRCVIGTSTMNQEEWIAANIFACFVSSLHHCGILQNLAIYFYYEKNVPYEDFYNSVINWCRNSDNEILNKPYQFLYNFYKNICLERPTESYCNEDVYGKIPCAPEYVAHMETIFRLEDYYEAIRPLLKTYESDDNILDEIIEYQKCVLKRPEHNNFSREFTYGWYEYFTKIIAGESALLNKYPNRVCVNNEKMPGNWYEYAFKDVWFDKNGGTFNAGITNELL